MVRLSGAKAMEPVGFACSAADFADIIDVSGCMAADRPLCATRAR